ncbi:hypothetical protein [Cellulosimicrobium sp. Marseille-Q8652]
MAGQCLDDLARHLKGQSLAEWDVDVPPTCRRDVSEGTKPRHREDALQDRLVTLDIGRPVTALRV